MSELLGLSFDVAASPSIWLRTLKAQDAGEHGAGWGFAWYPNETAAVVIRDPRPVADTTNTTTTNTIRLEAARSWALGLEQALAAGIPADLDNN